MRSTEHNGLRVVPKRRAEQACVSAFKGSGPQFSLFADPGPNAVVFARVSDITDEIFIDLIRYSQQGTIFDLRLAPRFDLGRLNRERAFDLFQRAQATYIDASSPLMAGGKKGEVIEKLAIRICDTAVSSKGPMIFLFGRNESSLASEAEVQQIIAGVRQEPEIISIPA